MKSSCAPLLKALRQPASMTGFDVATWDGVQRHAVAAGVLGRLGGLARKLDIDQRLPPSVRRKMQAVLTVAEQQQRAVRWELTQLTRTLANLTGPIVLLKGAAYAATNLAPATGRLFSDIDLLVPKAQIDAAEAALMLDGWITSHHDAYDQRYYRQWMHELPPMTHIRRQTVLDVHHNILPETARITTQPSLILAASQPVDGFPRFRIPCPVDLVLHSTTHLFHEGEWQHGLRDLVDIDALLRSFDGIPGFWDQLLERAEQLNLGRPLFYGLRYSQLLLDTPLPDGTLQRCAIHPGGLAASAMDALFLPAFATIHPDCKSASSNFATWCLYVRSHWLRMPPRLLIPHLVRKWWRKRLSGMTTKEPALTNQEKSG